MGSTGIPASGPGRGGHIEQAVAREIRRNKRVLALYSLLLVVPIGAALAYYHYGRTDAEIVRHELQTAVEPIKQVIEKTAPALEQVRETASQLSEQRARIQSISQQQATLAEAVRPVPEGLQRIDTIRAQVEQVDQKIQVVQEQNNKFRGSLEHAQAGVSKLSDSLDAVSKRQEGINQQLKDLSIRVNSVRPLQDIRPQEYENRLRNQQELIDSLRKRIEMLEKPNRRN